MVLHSTPVAMQAKASGNKLTTKNVLQAIIYVVTASLFSLSVFGSTTALETTSKHMFDGGNMDTEGLTESGYQVIDDAMEQAGGPSLWEVKDGKLTQSSNVYNTNYLDTDIDVLNEGSYRYGTKIIFGNNKWEDYVIEADLTPGSSSGSVSVLFKYRDDRNFYRYVMDHGKYASFVLKYSDGKQNVIARSKARYTHYSACGTYCTTSPSDANTPSALHTDDCAEKCLNVPDCRFFARGNHDRHADGQLYPGCRLSSASTCACSTDNQN